MMLAFVFCSCGNRAEEKRNEEISGYAKELHLANEKLAYYEPIIAKQDSALLVLKGKILDPKTPVDDKETYLKQYVDWTQARFANLTTVDKVKTQKSRVQRGINALNPTHDELMGYGLVNYLKW